jgi:hypothetical protein
VKPVWRCSIPRESICRGHLDVPFVPDTSESCPASPVSKTCERAAILSGSLEAFNDRYPAPSLQSLIRVLPIRRARECVAIFLGPVAYSHRIELLSEAPSEQLDELASSVWIRRVGPLFGGKTLDRPFIANGWPWWFGQVKKGEDDLLSDDPLSCYS